MTDREKLLEHNKAERDYIRQMWDIRARDKRCVKCFDTGYAEDFTTDDLLSPYASRTTVYECACGALQRQAADEHREKVKNKPLDSFLDKASHHFGMKRMAKQFIEQDNKRFFYVSGSVGVGKTHLCEAVVKELFEQTGKTTKTIKWRDFAKKVKADPLSDVLMMEINAIPILYIDDLFKAGGDKVTPADIQIAYDIVEHRLNANKWTLFSTEYSLEQLRDIDASVASRITQGAGKFKLHVASGKDMRGEM